MKTSKLQCECGRKSIYFKENEGRGYCKLCLSKYVEKNFKKTIGKEKLIENNDKIAVALSGGKDSSLLLFLLKKFFRNEIYAIIVDEGIGEYREKSIEKAKELCTKLGVKYEIVSFKEELGFSMKEIFENSEMRKKLVPCTYCGVFRRYLLNKKAREINANKLAVGINIEDEAESILMNIIRGDIERFVKLGAYPSIIEDEKFVPRIKPLRNLSEKEIILYDKIHKIPFEKKRCPFRGNSIRFDVRKILKNLEKRYPGTKYQIVRFYDKIKPFLLEKIKESREKEVKMNYCKFCGEPTSREFCKACELINKIKSGLLNKGNNSIEK
ncbi:MAG: TIGR00269 family protein [Candidatus Aenigmatarchaeota archaeon]